MKTNLVQEYIYDALLQLMKKENYDNITITAIVKRAGVSRMTYYRNYHSKEEILIRHIEQVSQQYCEKIKTQSKLSEMEFWTDFLNEFEKENIFGICHTAGIRTEFYKIYEKVIFKIAVERYHLDLKDHDVEVNIRFIMGGIMSMMMRRCLYSDCLTIEEAAGTISKHNPYGKK